MSGRLFLRWLVALSVRRGLVRVRGGRFSEQAGPYRRRVRAGRRQQSVRARLGKRLTETLGKTVLVDNRPGANGIIGTRLVANATPDGYTVILCDMAQTTQSVRLFHGAIRSDQGLCADHHARSAPIILIVHPAVPLQSLAEFIAAAKSQPGKIVMGSGGTGSTSHIAGEFFQLRTGTKLTHVPYKGTGPALADLVGGRSMHILASGRRHSTRHRGKGARAGDFFGETSHDRSRRADVRRIRRCRFSRRRLVRILAPAGTPRPVVLRLNKEMSPRCRRPKSKAVSTTHS